MSRLLGILALYVLMFLGWTGVGLLLVLAPARIGNLVHDSFGLCPRVAPGDRGKKLVLRLMGLVLLAFALRFALKVASFVRLGG